MGNCLKLQRAASWADGHEWEEWEEEVVDKGTTAAVGKMEERVGVKIRVSKRQLQELLEKAGGQDGKVRQVENVLAELMTAGVVCYHHRHHQQEEEEMMRGHWRPSLHSIPEAFEES